MNDKVGAMSPSYLTWPELTTRPRPVPDATIAYGPDPYQKIDLGRPAGMTPEVIDPRRR